MRLTYLIPRLIIAALLLAAVWISRDPLIQRTMIFEAQNATGAKVEIAQIRSSLSNNKLFLKELQIADPRDPMKNLVQAEMAYLELDRRNLLRRNFVVQHGRTSKLMFVVPRTSSGALTESSGDTTESANTDEPVDYDSKLEKIGRNWIDQIPPNQTDLDIGQFGEFELTALAKGIRDNWKSQITAHRKSIRRINPAIAQLKSTTTSSGLENPLRDQRQLQQSTGDLKQLEAEADGIRNSILNLQRTISQQKDLLVTAKTRDEQKLRQMTRSNLFEADAISQLLLYQNQGQLVEEVVAWFSWFRNSIPEPQQYLSPKSLRGTNIVFQGVAPEPSFLIKEIELEGEGRFANQHLNFAGTAYDLTPQPQLHSQPASFELRAQGNQHVIVNCQIDRRTDQPSDSLKIRCPDFQVAPQRLGHPQSLLVSMGPAGRVQADIDLRVDGDQLSGTLIFRHSNVSLHVDQLNDLAGGADTALRINQDLIKVNQFQSVVTLSGTLDDYHFDFESDLGPLFSATVDRVVIEDTEQKIAQAKIRLNEFLSQEIKFLEDSVASELEILSGELNQNYSLIAELRNELAPQDDPWPRIR